MSDMPETWALETIGALITLNPKNQCNDDTVVGFAPMQSLGTTYRAQIGYQRRPWKEVCKGYTHFADGDVLLAKITPCFENGKAGIVTGFPSGMGAGSTEYFVCRPNLAALTPRYLLAYFKNPSFLKLAETQMTGSVGHKRVPKEFLLDHQIPIAPVAEQNRIADKLGTLLARVDACRDRLDRVPAILKRFRQSVLTAATSGRLTEDWRGGTETNWPRMRAEEACSKVQSGGTPKGGFLETGVPFLKVYNIVDQKVKFDYKPQYVSLDIHSTELRKSQAQPGDVLMNIVGPPLGKVAIVPGDHATWNINQAITLFRPSEQVSSQWIYIVLCEGAPIREVLTRTKGSVGQVNISLSQCRAFELPVPSVEEQAEIVSRVEKLFAFADKLEERLFIGRKQAERLTPAILAKAFRGELVPQDPNDEPAAALLERIRTESAAAQAQPGTSTRGRPRKRLA